MSALEFKVCRLFVTHRALFIFKRWYGHGDQTDSVVVYRVMGIYLYTPFIDFVCRDIAVAVKAYTMPVKDSVIILDTFLDRPFW